MRIGETGSSSSSSVAYQHLKLGRQRKNFQNVSIDDYLFSRQDANVYKPQPSQKSVLISSHQNQPQTTAVKLASAKGKPTTKKQQFSSIQLQRQGNSTKGFKSFEQLNRVNTDALNTLNMPHYANLQQTDFRRTLSDNHTDSLPRSKSNLSPYKQQIVETINVKKQNIDAKYSNKIAMLKQNLLKQHTSMKDKPYKHSALRNHSE